MKDDRTGYYAIFAACAVAAMGMVLAFSDALKERTLLFLPLFFAGTAYALYKISGEVRPVSRRAKETVCPLTRSQLMFARLSKERRYGTLLQVAYISFFLRLQAAIDADVTKEWPVPSRPMISRGIDPDFVRRAREDYMSLRKGRATVSEVEFRTRVEELADCIKIIDGSRAGSNAKRRND